MPDLAVSLLAAALSTNPPAAVSNLVWSTTGVSIGIADLNDPVAREYRALLELDDRNHEEIDQMLKDDERMAVQGAPGVALNARIDQRIDEVRRAYEDFLARHPHHVPARVAYGSFLNDLGFEAGARGAWEKSLELAPDDPAILNNLANIYGHRGPVKRAFEYYEKAIRLSPREPLYYHNLANTVFLFRKDAREHYGLTEQEVFDKALRLFRRALALQPQDFVLAADFAQTFYGVKPPRHEEALAAWDGARQLARDDLERQGVHVHLARVNLNAGHYAAARDWLAQVNLPQFDELKSRVLRNLERKEVASGTGADAGLSLPEEPPPTNPPR